MQRLNLIIVSLTILWATAKYHAIKYETNALDLSPVSDLTSEADLYHAEEQPSQMFDGKSFPTGKQDSDIGSLTELRNNFPALLNHLYGNRYPSMAKKHKGGLTSDGFHGDVFTDGFGGTFRTVKRIIPVLSSTGRPSKTDRLNNFQRDIGKASNSRCSEEEGDEKLMNFTSGKEEDRIGRQYATQPLIDEYGTIAAIAADVIDNYDERRMPPSMYRYLYNGLRSSSENDRDKRGPIYMEGLKRIGALHHRNSGMFKKTPHRHVGIFNGDAFHSGLGAFETLRKRK